MWEPSIERRCSRPLLAIIVTPILPSLKWNYSKANDYWSSKKKSWVTTRLVTALNHTKKNTSFSKFILPGNVLTSRWWWTKNKRWWWWFILPGTVLTSPKVSHHATSSVTLFSPLPQTDWTNLPFIRIIFVTPFVTMQTQLGTCFSFCKFRRILWPMY